MHPEELRALQAPLKDGYREAPERALVTLKAAAHLDETAISCHVETGRALVEAGLHPATGGTGLLACSGDLLLQALVSAECMEFNDDGRVRRVLAHYAMGPDPAAA